QLVMTCDLSLHASMRRVSCGTGPARSWVADWIGGRSLMRALRIGGPGRVDLVEAPTPLVGEGEALVRVAYAGICATDRRLAQRGSDPPRVPGHEASGWLEDGTPVGIHPDVGCGACQHCRGGFDNRCTRRVSIGIDHDGGMAEWVAVPRHHLFPIDGIDLAVAALLEPLACCVHACSLLAVDHGAPSVVVGAGPM